MRIAYQPPWGDPAALGKELVEAGPKSVESGGSTGIFSIIGVIKLELEFRLMLLML